MVLHTFYFLIIFMSFPGNENYISRLGQGAGCFDGFAPFRDGECTLSLLLGKAVEHILQDIVRFFKPRIIGGEHYLIAEVHGFTRHERAFCPVTVAATTHHRDNVSLVVKHFVNGVQHIGQCVGRMCIVYNCRISFG